MKFVYLIKNKMDLVSQLFLTRPIEFFLTFRKKDPLEKIFSKLLYCKNKKKFLAIYYRIHQRSMNELTKLIWDLEIGFDWQYTHESYDDKISITLNENLSCDVYNLRIILTSQETSDSCKSNNVFTVTICDKERRFSESFLFTYDYSKAEKEKPFMFDSDEAREEAILEDLRDRFYSICQRLDQCPE